MTLHPEDAKRRLAINLWWALQHRADSKGYAWIASAMSDRTGDVVHVSRIQKILQQDTSPDWVFVFNLADILGLTVENLGELPTKAAERSYSERFPRIANRSA